VLQSVAATLQQRGIMLQSLLQQCRMRFSASTFATLQQADFAAGFMTLGGVFE